MWTNVTDCCIKIVHQITRRKSVLYVCERVKNNAGGAMAAAGERSTPRYVNPRSMQSDPTHGFPIQISLPDGETSHHHFNPSLRHNGGPEQEAELVRGYIKPPENKSLFDMEPLSPSRSCSVGILGDDTEWEGSTRTFVASLPSSAHPHRSFSTTSSPHPQYRHSAPLEAQNSCHAHYSTRGNRVSGGSSFSSSSSSSSISSGAAAGGGSPRGRMASFQMQFFPPSLSVRETTAPHREGRRHNRERGACPPPPGSTLRNPSSATSALADIAVVPCGAAELPQPLVADTGQGGCLALYAHPPEEDDPPPVYSEVISNPSRYRNVSKPERRTNRGRI